MIPSTTSPALNPAPAILSADRPAVHRGRLAGLALGLLLASLNSSIASAALPALARAFDATFPEVQWIVLSYLLAVTTLIVGAGRMGDRLGRRRLLLAGLGVFTAASLLCGLAGSLGFLLAARALQGLGAAIVLALSLAFVGDLVPPDRTGRAMGLLGAMSAFGTALGPSLGGWLIAGAGWRSVFLLSVPGGLVALGLVWRALPVDASRRVEERSGSDWPGMVLLGLTLAAYALALTWGRGRFGWLNGVLLLGAAGGAGVFIFGQSRAATPLLAPADFRDRALGVGLVLSALVSTVLMATLVVGPFHLARGLGLSAGPLGLALSAGPLVAALTGVPAGRLVDHWPAWRAMLAGLGGVGAGCTGLALLPPSWGLPGYLGAIMVLTGGYALFQTANNTAVMAAAGPERRGVVSGLLNLARNLGLITGTAAMGAVFARATGSADMASASPADVAAGMRLTFAVATGLVGLAIAVAVTGAKRGGG